MKSELNPYVSIIVPIYNSEKSLQKCIDTILEQSFKDFEVLLIDDGSKDESLKICKSYAARDKRIKSFSKENGGVSSARNYGIKNALGQWIAFIDSDDYISPMYLEKLCNEVQECQNSNSIVMENIGGERRALKIVKENKNISGQDMYRYFLENELFRLSAPYGKLYNAKIIRRNNILFPDGISMGEDMIFMGRYMNCVESAIVLKREDYIVTDTEGTLSKGYYSVDSEQKCFEYWLTEITDIVRKACYSKDIEEEVIWHNRTSSTFLRVIECLYKSNIEMSFSQKIKYMKSIPASQYTLFLKYHKCEGLNQKVIKFLIKHRLYLLFLLLGKISILIH